MVKFSKDEMVQPIDSEWFQFYTPGQDKDIQPFSDSNAAVRSLYDNNNIIANYLFMISIFIDFLFTEKFGLE